MINFNILVIHDNSYMLEIFNSISSTLKDCSIYYATNLEKAKQIIEEKFIHLIIHDLIMPELNSYKMSKEVKQHPNVINAYYIFMSKSNDKLLERLNSYTAGAHDVILKTSDIKEIELILVCKINYLKQIQNNNKNLLRGDFNLKSDVKKVEIGKKEINLTNLEYKLMEIFFQFPGQALQIDDIIKKVWGITEKTTPNNVRSFIYKLRTKIEENTQKSDYIICSKSKGYIFYPDGKPE